MSGFKPRFTRDNKQRLPLAAAVFVLFAGIGLVALGLSSAAPDDPPTERLIVQYKTGADQNNLQTTYKKHRGYRSRDNQRLNYSLVKVPQSERDKAMQDLAKDPEVESVRLDGTVRGAATPNDALYSKQTYWPKIGMDKVWDKTTGGNMTVAVIDSGIVANHTDLVGQIVAGHDFVDDDDVPTDGYGHGTATSGLIAAITNNSYGTASACWSCKIMPVRVLDDLNRGYVSDFVDGMTYAVDHGATILNMSLSTDATTEDPTIKTAVAYAKSHGAIIIAASGNDAIGDTKFPAGDPDVLSVGATDINDNLADFSNYGPTVDVAAPGVDIVTPYLITTTGDYKTWSGTSFSTPMIAGIFAVLKSTFTKATNDQVRNAITSTAVTCCGGKIGGGRVDAMAAYNNLAALFPTADTTKPTVAITAPAAGTTVSGASVAVTATASDNVGVAKVTMQVDSGAATTLTTAPYNFTLNTSSLTNGQHTITVTAYDAANNNAADSRTVTVSNSGSTTTQGDLNSDGKINLTDLSKLLSAWNTNNATADLNKSGKVDLTDLSILLSHWTG